MQLSDFSRILTHLRKDKGVSQKKAAQDLGVSQSLLSHYEKGIRECGLLFLVRAADYYGVTVDYLLGRSYDKNGNTIAIDDIPDEDSAGKGNIGLKSMLPTLNKKLICNSVSLIMDVLSKINNKNLTNDVSSYISIAVYKMFRLLYNSNSDNPQTLFGADELKYTYMADAQANSLQTNIIDDLNRLDEECKKTICLDEETIKNNYSTFASSLFNLLQNVETKIGARKK